MRFLGDFFLQQSPVIFALSFTGHNVPRLDIATLGDNLLFNLNVSAMSINKKPSFVYKNKKEEISGTAEDVLKFKAQQYNFRIKWAIIVALLSILGAAIRHYFFSP